MIIGYARVSTDDQNLDAQTDALTAAGAGKIFAEKISGAKRGRPELDRMLDQLRAGDVVTVTKYDRLARSLKDLLEIVETIGERGAGFRSLAEDIDTTTPAVSCFMCSPLLPSLSGNGFPNGPGKGWRLLENAGGSVAGPLPCQQPRRKKCGA